MAGPGGGAVRRALRYRDFRLVLVGVTISMSGLYLYNVALVVWVFAVTGTPAWVSAALLARIGASAVFATVGGALADRYERRRVLLACDLANALLMLAVAAVMATGGPVWLVIVLAGVTSAAGTPIEPAGAAFTPALVEEDDLVGANAARETVVNLGILAGPAVAGALLAVASPAVAVALNAVTSLVSWGANLAVRARSRPSPSTGDEPSLAVRIREGVGAITTNPAARLTVMLLTAVCMVLGVEQVAYVVAAEERLGLGAGGVGQLFAAIGLGGLAASFFAGRVAALDPGRVLVATTLLTAAPFAALGLVTHPAAALALLAVAGAAGMIFNVTAVTFLQRTLYADVLGRVFGILSMIAFCGMLVGAVAAPALIEAVGVHAAFLGVGGATVVVGLAAVPGMRRLTGAAEQRGAELEPAVELLGRVKIFAAADRPALEALAAALVREDVERGTDVVVEGEEPTDLYVVESGALAVVTTDGGAAAERTVATLGPGDYFGEIGLLQGIPRTATVRALEPGAVHRLPGEAFLAAVRVNRVLSQALRAGVVQRLAQTRASLGDIRSDVAEG